MTDLATRPATLELAPSSAMNELWDGAQSVARELAAKDRRIAELLEHNGKLAHALENALIALGRSDLRREALEEAGWDVLPALELNWKGARPIPQWHATGALRRVLEEGQ